MVTKKKTLIAVSEIAVIFLVGFLLGPTAGGSPFYGDVNVIDEGQFAAWANHMLHGKYLFKDIYITYGPLYVWPLFLFFKLLGPSIFLVKAYLTIGSIVGILIVNQLLKELRIQNTLRYVTIALFVLLPIMHLRQAMGYIVLLNLFKAVGTGRLLWYFLCGISLVICFLVSPEIGIFTAMIVILFFFIRLLVENNIKDVFSNGGLLVAGVLAAGLSFIFWAGYEGWLFSYFQGTLDIMTSLSGINSPNGQNFPNILNQLPVTADPVLLLKFILSKDALLYWTLFFYVLLIGYLVIRFILQIHEKKDLQIVLLTIYGILLYTILLSRNGIGHFFFVLSPLIILAACFFDKLFRILRQKKTRQIEKNFAVVEVCIIVLFALRLLTVNRPEIFKRLQIPFSISTLTQNPPRFGSTALPSSQKQQLSMIQNYILQQTTAYDTVFIVSNEPILYMLFDRVNPTRYDLPFIANPLEKRFELLSDLMRNSPRYIVENQKSWAVDGVSNRKRLPEIYKYLEKHYQKTTSVGDYMVYERNK